MHGEVNTVDVAVYALLSSGPVLLDYGQGQARRYEMLKLNRV